MENFLHQKHPARVVICGPNCCGKAVFPTNLILNNVNENEKVYTYSLTLHPCFSQKIIKCFSKYKPIQIKPNNLNEQGIDVVIDDIVNNKDLQDIRYPNRDI